MYLLCRVSVSSFTQKIYNHVRLGNGVRPGVRPSGLSTGICSRSMTRTILTPSYTTINWITQSTYVCVFIVTPSEY